MAGSPFGVAWGFLYGPPWTEAEAYMPVLRQMGAGLTKVNLFWSQLEPEEGRFDWRALDAFVGQLKSPDEGLVALFSSSTWGTRQASAMLPPSPAEDLDTYYRFIHTVVSHCKGRARYWQNDSEPNNAAFWAGTPEEFVAQLRVFGRAVRDADPAAVVVAGGYDGLFNVGGMWKFPGQERGLAFFDTVLREASDAFDIFDMRLYADAYTIPERVEYMRRRMQDLGCPKPIICTEYNGPGFFERPVNMKYLGIAATWSEAVAAEVAADGSAKQDAGPAAIRRMYDRMASLDPQTQMFMEGCPKPLDAKLRRMQCRDLVMRNVLGLSAGVGKMMFWDLWHDTSKRDDLMHLMYAKLKLMDHEDGALRRRHPAADAFCRMTTALEGVTQVTRVELPERPSACLFRAMRRERGPAYVVWDRRDAFSGEDAPSVRVAWELEAQTATGSDALGNVVPVTVADGTASLDVGVTPVFVEPSR
jgi:hypothetical protein